MIYSLRGVTTRVEQALLVSFLLGKHFGLGFPLTGTIRDHIEELFPVRVTASIAIGVLGRIAGIRITDSRTMTQLIDKPPPLPR